MNLFHEKNLFLTEAKTEIQLIVQRYFSSEKIMNSSAYYVCRILERSAAGVSGTRCHHYNGCHVKVNVKL